MRLNKDEICLIINQDARLVATKKDIIKDLAKKNRLKPIFCSGVDLDFTIRQQLQNKNLKRLVIAGGDGSVATAAHLICRSKNPIELAVIPLGTANYYAKSLGLKTLAKAFRVATSGVKETRHLCEANNRVFLIAVDIGVTSHMFDKVTDINKKRFGKLAYVWGVIRLLFEIDPIKITIEANGEKHSYSTSELLVINHSIEEKLKLVPDVHSKEPYFEIVTYGLSHTRISALLAFLIFVLTFGRNQKYLKRIKATEATISTEKIEKVSLDGDTLENTPVNIKVINTPVDFIRA